MQLIDEQIRASVSKIIIPRVRVKKTDNLCVTDAITARVCEVRPCAQMIACTRERQSIVRTLSSNCQKIVKGLSCETVTQGTRPCVYSVVLCLKRSYDSFLVSKNDQEIRNGIFQSAETVHVPPKT